MRVMIVDDSGEMRQLIRETLAPWTSDVAECSDGDQAVLRYAEFLPDWTVMDFRMGRVDGLTAIRDIRTRWPHARILLLTSFESEAVHEEALARGATACLSKDALTRLPACLGAATANLHPAPAPLPHVP